MFGLYLVVIGYLSFFFGTIAFAQIIGGIRTRSHYFAVVFWLIMVIVLSFVVIKFLYDYLIAYIAGMIISFLVMNGQPKIE